MFGRFLLLMTNPIITAPSMIAAAMTGRYLPIVANAGVWLVVGACDAVGVGFAVGFGVGVDFGVEVGVLIAKPAVIVPVPFIVAVAEAMVALLKVIDPVLEDQEEKV